MERREEELIQRYATQDPELRALHDEHQDLKRQLDAFRHRPYLTPEEELEVKRLQKLKLASKDRIMAILERHQHDFAN
ncbi:MAG TPA: DUF465 domain-containing protein [Candidatus Binataceae bacterium]|jgi:hypothetical protein|nr:DUF465 domain-containing protein [Candidatus Binataceae bacterium]